MIPNLSADAVGTRRWTGCAGFPGGTQFAGCAGKFPSFLLDFAGSFEKAIAFIAANGTAARTGLGMLYDSSISAWRYNDHNLALQSEAFNVTWTTTDTTPSQDGTTHPLGASVWLLTEGSAGTARTAQDVTVGTGQNLVHSRDIKRGNHDWIQINITNGANTVRKWFNLATGAVGSVTVAGTGIAGTAISVVDLGGGWYRFSVTGFIGGQTVYSLATASASADASNTRVNGATRYETRAQASVGTLLLNYKKTTSAAYYHPRFHTDPTSNVSGLLTEPAATNSIRNNTGQGVVAGVIGSGGNAGTNWTVQIITTTGLTRTVVGNGTENGIAYTDYTIAGTATGNGSLQIVSESTAGIAGLTGQVWVPSAYVKLQVGDLTGLSAPVLGVSEYTNVPAFIKFTSAAVSSPTGAALNTQRQNANITTSGGGTTAFVQPLWQMSIADGAAVNVTLRVGWFQMERDRLTSPIETFGAAVTRAADAQAITTLSSIGFNNTEGMVVFKGASNDAASTAGIYGWALTTDANNIMYSDANSSNRRFVATDTNVVQAAINAGTQPAAGTSFKLASAYRANDFAASLNGAATVTDTSGTVPTISVKMDIGQTGGTGSFNGIIQSISYYPRHPGAAKVPRYSV